MAQIIKFRTKSDVDKVGRVKALVKGEIDVFTCDNCGETIEVVKGKYPSHCPGCNLIITQWNNN